ncbi:hypothetical protein [Salinibaculum rarum]|uniref:hypothetical protein n=1 Tax=Salinibaculum rarum TaxID=3058903 RepID=UPI00265E2ADA|nr:hypothetical protein [Salinibaculum sp. KK48]
MSDVNDDLSPSAPLMDGAYEYPAPHGFDTADIVRRLHVGDYAAYQRPTRDGAITWTSGWVTDGRELTETVSFCGLEFEVVEANADAARFCYGNDGVVVYQNGRLRNGNGTLPAAAGIERIPSTVLAEHDWYTWEVGLTPEPGDRDQQDQTLLVEAPTKAQAHETAKRRAEMEHATVRVCYQEDEIVEPATFGSP